MQKAQCRGTTIYICIRIGALYKLSVGKIEYKRMKYRKAIHASDSHMPKIVAKLRCHHVCVFQ